VAVLTGAGLSTASGIPDFRSPGGLWERHRAVPIDEFLASPEARIGYWRHKGETWERLVRSRPNAAHEALTGLANGGRVEVLVTQNVDGLHERAAFPAERLIRIHGTDLEVGCLACGRRLPRAGVHERWRAGEAAPRCGCGGFLKPATVSFGQSVDPGDLRRALAAARACDLLVAAGTSLVVGPINRMVPAARQAGARIAILTASETPFDGLAEFRLHRPIESALPAIALAVLHPGAAAGAAPSPA
jgi:NAD-dependent protein deacetylase/lipoamidase